MSASAGGDKCEPNLTPLLDMVLQLIMFFMLCANFVMEQVNESVKLPLAVEAKALDKTVDNYIILNVMADQNSDKSLTTIGGGEPLNPVQVTNTLKNQFELDKARTKPVDWEARKGRSVLILRGDVGDPGDPAKGRPPRRGCNYKMIDDVMSACRQAGYEDIRLRTIRAADDRGR